ncbi:MAG: PAS domain-containing sensor histidine kinase [Desulfobacteraceae bacterium]|nr:PAS domain-containing sensor histidine kinase [Desulfobacteraceae bacterium]
MTFSYLPLFFIDVFGSVLMIILSFACLLKSIRLRRNDPKNVLISFLVWICCGLLLFAVSRSCGHIVKQLLLVYGYQDIWEDIRPFSGSVNTFAFILVASITIFFRQIWKIHIQVLDDRKKLVDAHKELVFLNENLEKLVRERTLKLEKEASQRAELEKHMVQAEKLSAIGELSSGVAHEINNPLGIILGYCQLLLRHEKDTQKIDDLKIIEKHVKSCKAIVQDLLNFSRSSKPLKKLYSINSIIEEITNYVKTHSSFEKIEIIKYFSNDIPEICIDSEKIKQVFFNLIMNANHAMNQNGKIIIKTTCENENIRIDIEDTGEGIKEENITRIFDPFFTTKPTGKGTGLGLSVSYGIIKNHGGDIKVSSSLKKGSVFSIYLPFDNSCIINEAQN